MRIDQWIGEAVEVVLEFGEDRLPVTWSPRSFTVAMQEEIDKEPARGAVAALAQIVKKWELQDSKGKPVKLDEESLKQLPFALLLDIFNKLLETQRPPAPSSTNSTFG